MDHEMLCCTDAEAPEVVPVTLETSGKPQSCLSLAVQGDRVQGVGRARELGKFAINRYCGLSGNLTPAKRNEKE